MDVPWYNTSLEEEANQSFSQRMRSLFSKVFVQYWAYWAATLTLALINIFEFAFANSAWGVTTEFTRFGLQLMNLVGIDTSNWEYAKLIKVQGMPWDRSSAWIVFGMLLGALIGALFSTNFKIRVPHQKRRLVQGFAGGILAGFGARLAMGCNLGSFFSAIPQFSLHGWIFMLGLFGGTFVGTKIALHPILLGKPERRVRSTPVSASSRRSIQPFIGGLVALISAGIVIWYINGPLWKLGVMALFGIAFGFVIERGRICFTSAFREFWITRQGDMARALALAMMVSTIGFAIVSSISGRAVKVEPASLGVLIGGLLFGIGIVIAGGCETGWMYRSMEGYVQLWMAGIGTIVGTVILAYGWGAWGIYDALVKPYQEVNIAKELGWPWAIVVTIAGLAIWYIATTWWEARQEKQEVAVEKTETKTAPAAGR